MASINVGSQHGKRKQVDAEVPLIPFIDLLLCCVMFLLVTAVWNQLGSPAGESFDIPKLAGAYDLSALAQRLKGYHDADPNRHDLTLVADDDVTYESLVQAMDAAAAEGFKGLSFSDT